MNVFNMETLEWEQHPEEGDSTIGVVGMRSEQSLEAAILRCRCGHPDMLHPGEPCPFAQRVELGEIASSRDGTIKIAKD